MYYNTNLIARRGYGGRPAGRAGLSGLGSVLDDAWSALKSGAGSALDFYGKTQQQQGANAALEAQNAQLAAALAAQRSSGPDLTTIAVIGGIGIAAILLLKKK